MLKTSVDKVVEFDNVQTGFAESRHLHPILIDQSLSIKF